MIRRKTPIAVLLSTVLISGTAIAARVAQPAGATAPALPVESPHDRLFRLFQESDEAQLKRNPLLGIFRGDLRYADQFGDYITEEYYGKEKAASEADLTALHSIDRASLSPTDQLAYDVFEFQTKDTLKSYEPQYLNVTKVRPINHYTSHHTFYPAFSSGDSAAPFKTVADYENAMKRHAGYVLLLDRSLDRMKEGEAAGVFETKMTIKNVIEQFDTQLKQPVEESPFYQPIKKFPADFSAADKARLEAAYRSVIANDIYPMMRRVRAYLETDYLPKARDGYGLMYMKGGKELYVYLVQSNTTLSLTPEEIHETGHKEVARITAEMEKARQEAGFQGTLPQFFDYLRTDPKFKKPTREALTQGYYEIGKLVDAKLPAYFSNVPKSKLEIRPYEPYREKFEAGGSYEQGTADGTRPGIFYFNAYDLPTRTTPGMTTLYLHEGAPGHHFQLMLSRENDALPPFIRFGGHTAFVEGWGLYAETLGYEMGFYKDPIQRFGTLSDEMLRATRLVVDTGIHSKGWTREQAIDYMLAHSDISKTDATAEVERYISWPGQALAYKTGAMTIQKLRRKAEAELGSKFDIREFHAQVLMTGSLPLAILEQKIDRWIASKKAS